MAVSKHNLWKRKKNGIMKLVRSHKVWKKRQNLDKMSVKHIKSGVRTVATNSDKTTPVVSTAKSSNNSSAKRTQIGKKV